MDYKARATKLETLSREQLKRAAKVLKLKGYSNKNKVELIAAIMEAGKKIRLAEYDAESAILKVREALGLSTSGNIKSRTQGLRKSKKEDAKTPKQIASEALTAMREALAIKDSPKLKRQFLARMRKEMNDFEKDIDKITSNIPISVERKMRRKKNIDSANMLVDL